MKNILKFKKLGFVLLLAIMGVSCSSDDSDSTPADTTITGIASGNPDLSILVQALVKAGLADDLQSAGPFTVFAPTNNAFMTFLGAKGFTKLDDVPVEDLKQILYNHVLNGKLQAANLVTGYEKTLAVGGASATNKLNLYVSNTASGVKLNGVSKVTTKDVVASNGVIHIVDAVIGLPTIVTHATANPTFSILVAALTRADQPNFAAILSGTAAPSPFTVFAPTDQAFGDFLIENKFADLAAIPQNVLEKTLKYHVVTGTNALASSLMQDQVIPTYSGESVIVKTSPTRLRDVSNRDCNIVVTDVQCSNGVIHVLSKVLLPTFN